MPYHFTCPVCSSPFSAHIKTRICCSYLCSGILKSGNLSERFWKLVTKRGIEECWPWQGHLDSDGYGQISFRGEQRSAHRVSYELNIGPIPEGMNVLHSCDNPPCVNYHHLFAGTQSDNMKDCRKKGRTSQLKGEKNGAAKLTAGQVLFLRFLRNDGLSQSELAEKFSITKTNVRYILKRKTWAHI